MVVSQKIKHQTSFETFIDLVASCNKGPILDETRLKKGGFIPKLRMIANLINKFFIYIQSDFFTFQPLIQF